jgi:NitT/TauT family transport system substrate-binding protein
MKKGSVPPLSRSEWIASGCAAGVAAAWPAPARSQTAKVRVGSIVSDTFGMAYYGLDAGIFERAGIDVEILPFTNSAPMAAAVAGGSLDVGIGEATVLANGVMRGLPFAIIAGGAMYLTTEPTTLLCVAKTSTIKTARDLEGQTIACPGSVGLSNAAVCAWLVENGADLKKVHFVEMALSEMAPAVSRGTIAAANIGEPQLSAGMAVLTPLAKTYDAIAPKFLLSDWFSTRDWVAQNKDTAKRFVAAAYETARWANANREQSLAILVKRGKFDEESVRHMSRATYATSLDAALIQPVLDQGAKFNMLPHPINAADLIVRV